MLTADFEFINSLIRSLSPIQLCYFIPHLSGKLAFELGNAYEYAYLNQEGHDSTWYEF